jgi:hypothetical protein
MNTLILTPTLELFTRRSNITVRKVKYINSF